MSVPAVVRTAPSRISIERLVAIAGIVLGLAAFWIALPPVHARSAIPRIAVGLGALAAGELAIVR